MTRANKITHTIINVLIMVALLTGISSCKKKYDEPPQHVIPESGRITIAGLKSLFTGTTYKINGDVNLYCTVIADETSGNFYKESYVRDATGAIHIKILNSGGLYIGDSIRINLKGVSLVRNQNNFELDSVNVDNMITKQTSGLHPQPIVTSLAAITSSATNSILSGQLIQLSGVEFVSVDKNKVFADVMTQTSVNRTLTACGSATNVVLYTSAYANFASQFTPSGSGNITAIMTFYGNKPELIIRSLNDVNFSGPACPSPTFVIGSPVPFINETFSGVSNGVAFSSGDWINFNEIGSVKWKGDINGTNTALKASAYNSGDSDNSIWLITPPVIYSNTMTLSFKTGFGFWDPGHPNPIMAYISTDFNGLNFKTANWTAISNASYTNGSGSYYPNAITLSGAINLNSLSLLSGYSGNFFIAFKYYGNTVYNSNIYLDDILIQ